MSGKLDQSLDQIMKDTGKPANGRGRRPRVPRTAKSKAKAAIRAPTGGVQKNRPDTRAPTAASALTSKATGDSKIIVSNLPEDVTETQIKDYFGKTIGSVKKVMLTFGPSGRSRGIAQIIFAGPNSATEAAKQLDGVKVDNKAMKIEVVLAAKAAPGAPAPKGLADRMSQPKSAARDKTRAQAKPKTNNAAATTNGASKAKNERTKKPARNGRPKKKTAEELDAEMVDYFGAGEGGAPNGTAQQAVPAGGDAMVDEVL